jgi:hypothetical protein
MANAFRTSIGLKKTTKEGLDKNKAPGQCYDGFICQLIELWEKVKEERQDYILNPDKREVTPID